MPAINTRAKRSAGFSLWECWGGALDYDPKSPRGQAARYMYENVFDGVRLMMKFIEWDKHPDQVQIMLERFRRAREYGLKTILVADWFNQASGPGTYHKSIYKPSHDRMVHIVRAMIDTFDPDILEVCNEPNYIKGKRYSADRYVDDVTAYVRACESCNFRGKVLATGSRPDIGWKIKEGWEFHAKRWERGMLEGKHTLVLHKIVDPMKIRGALIDKFHQGKAIGYQWPVFESEFSGVGRGPSTDSALGAKLTLAGYYAASDKQFPLCYLTMGGAHDGFGSPNPAAWGMQTDLINRHGKLSKTALALANAEGAPPFVLEDPPAPPPPDDGGNGDGDPDVEDPPADDGGTDWGPRIDRALDLLERLIDVAEEHPEWIDMLIVLAKFNPKMIMDWITDRLD